jgi:hypothetical protein
MRVEEARRGSAQTISAAQKSRVSAHESRMSAGVAHDAHERRSAPYSAQASATESRVTESRVSESLAWSLQMGTEMSRSANIY